MSGEWVQRYFDVQGVIGVLGVKESMSTTRIEAVLNRAGHPPQALQKEISDTVEKMNCATMDSGRGSKRSNVIRLSKTNTAECDDCHYTNDCILRLMMFNSQNARLLSREVLAFVINNQE